MLDSARREAPRGDAGHTTVFPVLAVSSVLHAVAVVVAVAAVAVVVPCTHGQCSLRFTRSPRRATFIRMAPTLFTELRLRDLTLKNRIAVSPMCQYSSTDGFADDWHLVHLGQFAIGGAGLVITEACAVSPAGRISPWDLGLWDDAHVPMLARITAFLRAQGAASAVQLAHAGRKASAERPWAGGGPLPPAHPLAWPVMGPSAIPFADGWPVPHAMTDADIDATIADFVAATRRADAAGFDAIELHGAHGYLLHAFLSPLSNERTDGWGGDRAGRMRFPLAVIDAVRDAWPAHKPLLLRVSATDWVEGGLTLEDTLALACEATARGVDLVDCSTGGNVATARIPAAPGYQVPYAAAVRREIGVPTGAVGLITGAAEAEAIVARGDADLVLLARELLRDPHWPLRAAAALGADVPWPPQYERARPFRLG